MNQKTAKLLSRAAVSLSLIAVAQAKADGADWGDKRRHEILQSTIARTQRNLKAQWTGMPRRDRGAARKRLKALVVRTKQSLQKGMSHAAQS